ncbi:MAG: insulinase family protein [Ruminococcaceae bacterium]|nr:insulinase family protein [Oscillospiraceae bacterium]
MINTITYDIQPGIRLHHIATEQFKTVSIGIHFHQQLTREEAAKNALLSDVMRRGNSKFQNTAAINRYMQSLYGAYFDADIKRKGEDQILSFVISVVEDTYLPKGETCVLEAFSALLDMVLCPLVVDGGFRSDYVEQEKVNLINDIEALINDKRTYALWRLIENMCQNDAYSIYELGDKTSVESITPKVLYEQYRTIIHQSPVDIFVTGNTNIQPIVNMALERFKKIASTRTSYPQTSLYMPTGTYQSIEEVYEVSQAKLSMGFYTGIGPKDPRYSALMVFNSIFGSGAHSKLFNNVREKLSLAYYASSRLERSKGIMAVSSGIEYQNREKAEAEILAQLTAMKEGDITDYEFDVSVKSIINSLRSMQDSAGYLADYYLGQAVSGTLISLEEQCRLISCVTKDEVIAVANVIQPEMVYVMRGEQ